MAETLTAQEMHELAAASGYFGYMKAPATGEWMTVCRFIFTWGLLVGVDRVGYRTRFCYHHGADALVALATWDGSGDPPGDWIKEKGRNERDNPNLFKGVPIVTEQVQKP